MTTETLPDAERGLLLALLYAALTEPGAPHDLLERLLVIAKKLEGTDKKVIIESP